jgi:benzylsuccinate CoA-transferase BbsF subunit
MITCFLADLGAEVIKIEHNERLDSSRLRGRPIIKGKKIQGKSIELSPLFHNLNRNKLSITLNLKTSQGLYLFKELVRKSDAIVENFAPEALKKMGLDYESLKGLKPDLVMLSLHAVGETGPLSRLRAYAPVLSSLSGVEYLVGYEGKPPLGMMTFGLSDPNAGAQGLFTLLAALYRKEISGEGCYIKMSQLEACLVCMGEALLEYQMTGRIPGPRGNFDRAKAPYGIYPAKGKDKWVAISVESDEQWAGLVRAIGNPEWAGDGKFLSSDRRFQHRKLLDKRLKEWTSVRNVKEVIFRLRKEGVPVAPVLSLEETYDDEHYRYRGIYHKLPHPDIGEEIIYCIPWQMSESRGSIRATAPALGEHNHYVFGHILGMTAEEIKNYQLEKIIY